MRKRIVLICILICIIAAICCTLFACDMIISVIKKQTEEPPTYSEWKGNGDGTHSRYDLSDSTQTQSEKCDMTSTVIAPTCSAKGYTLYRCSKCDYSYQADETAIDPKAHDIVTHTAQDPTCTEDGWAAYETCKLCSYTTYSPILAPGHDFGAWEYADAERHSRVCAKCALKDYAAHDDALLRNEENHYYYCSVCKTQHGEEAHIPEIDPAVAPTCVSDGLTEGSHCAVCSIVLQAQKPVFSEYTAHSYVNHAAAEPTCTEDGNKAYRTCSRCSYSEYEEKRIPALGHNYTYKSSIPATCIAYEKTISVCTRCSNEKVETTGSIYAPHEYDGYTCKHCQKDEMSEYKADFDAHGNASDDLIAFSDTHTLGIFLDYLLVEWITTPKYCIYEDVTDAETLRAIYSSAMSLQTTQTWDFNLISYGKEDSISYFTLACSNEGKCDPENICTITPESGEYDPDILPQMDYLSIDREEESARTVSFEAFPYLTRSHTMEVTTSDQLFYAFEHGYRPLPAKGSAAAHILEKAKDVDREIISNNMTDLEKLYAIMQWIVKNVAYDNGAFDGSSKGTLKNPYQCTSWYAEGVFDYQISVCDGISKSVCILAGLEDIKCVRVCGNAHAWNRVWIDAGDGKKNWYVMDATHANLNLGGLFEAFSLNQFLLTDDQKSTLKYPADNYKDTAEAVTSINPFSTLHYGEDSHSEANNLVIEDEEELTALLTYAASKAEDAETEYFTLNFFLPSSFCANQTAAIDTVSDAIGKPFSYDIKAVSFAGTDGLSFLMLLPAE